MRRQSESEDKPDDKILFIDARHIFTQIDRAGREFNEELNELNKESKDLEHLINHNINRITGS